MTRIKIEGDIAKSSVEKGREDLAKEEKLKVLDDIENMLSTGEATDFEVWCEGEVIKCHKLIFSGRYSSRNYRGFIKKSALFGNHNFRHFVIRNH